MVVGLGDIAKNIIVIIFSILIDIDILITIYDLKLLKPEETRVFIS